MLEQADMSFALIRDPNAYVKRGREALKAAIELSKHLATENPAAKLGAKGGQKTAERGSEHFKQLAAMRKTRAGGRPKKSLIDSDIAQ